MPPTPPHPDGDICRWCGVVRCAFAVDTRSGLPEGMRICMTCDMGGDGSGPPVLLDYIRKGYR